MSIKNRRTAACFVDVLTAAIDKQTFGAWQLTLDGTRCVCAIYVALL